MFEKLLQKQQEKFAKSVKGILVEMENDFNDFWKETIEGVTKEKMEKEQELITVQNELERKDTELSNISEEIVKLSKATESEKLNIKKYEARKKELFDNILSLEEREVKAKETEEQLNKKEENLIMQENALRLKEKLFEDKQKSFNRYFDKPI